MLGYGTVWDVLYMILDYERLQDILRDIFEKIHQVEVRNITTKQDFALGGVIYPVFFLFFVA
jgi:hypothetical protein